MRNMKRRGIDDEHQTNKRRKVSETAQLNFGPLDYEDDSYILYYTGDNDTSIEGKNANFAFL